MAVNYHGTCFITLAAGGSMGHRYVLQLYLVKRHKIGDNSATTEARVKNKRFGILRIFLMFVRLNLKTFI